MHMIKPNKYLLFMNQKKKSMQLNNIKPICKQIEIFKMYGMNCKNSVKYLDELCKIRNTDANNKVIR